MSPATIWLALPAYNEERSLPALLLRCIPVAEELGRRGGRLAVLVVDDGSQDGTAEAARAFADRLTASIAGSAPRYAPGSWRRSTARHPATTLPRWTRTTPTIRCCCPRWPNASSASEPTS